AELSGKRMEVSRQILGFYNGLKNFESQIGAAKANLELAHAKFETNERAFKSKAISQSEMQQSQADVRQAEAAVMQIMAQRDQVTKELHLLAGKAMPVAMPWPKSPTKSSGASL